MQIRDAATLYQTQLEADGRSGHTQAQYRRHLELLASWADAQGDTSEIEDLSHQDVARFLSSPQARTRADGTPKRAASVNALRSNLRTFLGYAHAAGWAQENSARLVRRARTGTAPPRALSREEEKRLLEEFAKAETAEDQRDGILFRLMLEAGLRIGSVLGIRRDEVDLPQSIVRVWLKGDRVEDVILPPRIRDDLALFLRDRAPGYLFEGRSGKPLACRHVQRRFVMWRERAGIRSSMTCHSLRHTFATRLYSRTGDIALVQQALTHRSVSSTVIYAGVDRDRIRAALGVAVVPTL